jgi:hypothetical protein
MVLRLTAKVSSGGMVGASWAYATLRCVEAGGTVSPPSTRDLAQEETTLIGGCVVLAGLIRRWMCCWVLPPRSLAQGEKDVAWRRM